MDLFKYCRTCTEEKMDMINIHEMRNNGTSISDMLVCVGIDEALSSVLPQQMCSCCETKLQTVYNFHLQCRTSYAKFLNCLKIEASETKVQNCYKIGDEYSSEHKNDGDDHQFKYELNEDTNEDEENGTALLQKSTNIDTNITDCKSEDMMASDNETELGKTNMESDKQTTGEESDGDVKPSSYCSMCSKSFYTENALMFHQLFVHKMSFTQDSAITTNIVGRKRYIKHSSQDRQRILACASKGEDWVTLSSQLNVPYKTAYAWIRSGNDTPLPKGGKKLKILTEEEVDVIVSWVEEDSGLTLTQMKQKIQTTFQKCVSVSTVGNYLEGRVISYKQVHYKPVTMNTPENKVKRADYVRNLSTLIQQGKQIVWLDETNFHLFCRRTKGRFKIGERAVQKLPASKGPNIHLICAISATGLLAMEKRQGSFSSQSANEWVQKLMRIWQDNGNSLEDLVIVVDNTPCHRRLEEIFNGTPATLLRLAPYSPMLNPVETVWSKVKAFVKEKLRVPQVQPQAVREQALVYLENIIDQARNTIVDGDCAGAVQHTSTFHSAALELEDMRVGR